MVSQTTVTVAPAPVVTAPLRRPPPTTTITTNDLHLSATFDAASHIIHITGIS